MTKAIFKIRSVLLPALFTVLFSTVLSPYANAVDVSKLPKEAIKALYLSQQALQEENFKETARILTEYMGTAKEAIPLPAYQMLGNAYYQNQDLENAWQTFRQAHGDFPQNTEMLQNYTILTYETGRLEDAARLFEKLYRLKGKTDKKILYQAAGIYFQAERLKEAKRVLNELLTSGGELNPKWYEEIIALCVEQQQWRDAERWAKEFLEKEPHRSEYWRLLAQMRLDREEYKSAAAALEIAYRLENPTTNGWLELSDLYLYLNAPLMAVRCMEAAYTGEVPLDRKRRIASVYARTQRFDKALDYLNAAIKEAPSAVLYFEKGRLLYDAMRYEQAISALKACVQLDPDYGQAHILAGFAAWNLNAFETARSCFAAASTLPEFRDQANDAVMVLDDLMAALSEQ